MNPIRIIMLALVLCLIVRVSSPIVPLPSTLWPSPAEPDLPDHDEEPLPDPENLEVEASDLTDLERIDTTIDVCTDCIDAGATRSCLHRNHADFVPPATDSIYALKQLRI